MASEKAANEEGKDDKRKDFLLQFYDASWDNVTRADDAAWKMFAAYAAVFAGLAVAFSAIGVVGFLSIMTIFSFLAIALALNGNLWFVRNIGQISNIEAEFLLQTDYGVIVPKKYRHKVSFFSLEHFEAWWVLIFGYFAINIALLAVLLPQIKDCVDIEYVLSVYTLSLILTVIYGVLLDRRHKRFMKNAPGRLMGIEN
jgi:hypothetical protein